MKQSNLFVKINSKIKIREKLIISIGGIALLAFTILGLTIYYRMSMNTQKMIENELQKTVFLVRDVVTTAIEVSVKNYLRSISEKNHDLLELFYKQFTQGSLSQAEMTDRFKKIILDPTYGKIGETGYLAGVNTKGILVIHPKSEGVDASKHDFMKKTIQMKNGYIEYEWKNEGEKVTRKKAGYVSYFEPLDILIWASSYKDEFVSLLRIDDFREKINNIQIGKTGYVYILDNKGTFVVHKHGLEGQNHINTKDENGFSFIAEILKQKEGMLYYDWKFSEQEKYKKKLAYFTYIPEMGWYIVANSYIDEYYAPLNAIRNIIIITIMVSFAILFLVVSYVISRFLQPLQEARNVVNGVAEGDLTQKLQLNSKDEFAEMAGFLNLLIENFRGLLIKLQSFSFTLSTSTQNLSVTSKEISATSNNQAASVKEIVSTMEDSNSMNKQIANSISEVYKIATGTKDSVEYGVSLIRSSLEKMQEIKIKSRDTISGIKTLGNKIENIWEIVNIINGIVDQTKIIAFNAALEASSAGEAGKNFQIVASEIKRLADNTMVSTREIKTKINEIQSSSNNLIIISEEGTERVKEGWELSNKIEEVFNEILNSAEISAKSAGQIELSTKQQVAAFEQILIALKEISGGIENFVISTKHTSETSESLKNIVDDLKEIVQKYKINPGVKIGSE